MESTDFTRWDLLYNKKGKNSQEINSVYSKFAMKYARYINFIGGLAIFILGIQAMAWAIPGMLAFLP